MHSYIAEYWWILMNIALYDLVTKSLARAHYITDSISYYIIISLEMLPNDTHDIAFFP